jgi:gliding motility-associated-like protein
MSYSLKIYERNGQVIFNSRDPNAGWDGTFKGAKQNSGVYVYLCLYRFHNKPEKILKGTIMLIR